MSNIQETTRRVPGDPNLHLLLLYPELERTALSIVDANRNKNALLGHTSSASLVNAFFALFAAIKMYNRSQIYDSAKIPADELAGSDILRITLNQTDPEAKEFFAALKYALDRSQRENEVQSLENIQLSLYVATLKGNDNTRVIMLKITLLDKNSCLHIHLHSGKNATVKEMSGIFALLQSDQQMINSIVLEAIIAIATSLHLAKASRFKEANP